MAPRMYYSMKVSLPGRWPPTAFRTGALEHIISVLKWEKLEAKAIHRTSGSWRPGSLKSTSVFLLIFKSYSSTFPLVRSLLSIHHLYHFPLLLILFLFPFITTLFMYNKPSVNCTWLKSIGKIWCMDTFREGSLQSRKYICYVQKFLWIPLQS